jgi:hypothetical protein
MEGRLLVGEDQGIFFMILYLKDFADAHGNAGQVVPDGAAPWQQGGPT